MRVLELEADNREAAQGKGARSMSTNAHEVEHTHLGGVELDIGSKEDSRGERSGTAWRRLY
jgi:hypothetical protein